MSGGQFLRDEKAIVKEFFKNRFFCKVVWSMRGLEREMTHNGCGDGQTARGSRGVPVVTGCSG